jgi:hypothetical protein
MPSLSSSAQITPLMRSLALLFLACVVTSTQAQSMSYSDADTPGQAVGMMNTSTVSAGKMLSECGSRFPESVAGMSKNLRAWQETEKSVLRKAKFHWGNAVRTDPNLQKLVPYVEGTVARQIENMANAPLPAANNVLRDYCTKYFDDLASGVWRTRTPRAYKYLDQAPGVP